MWNRSVCATVCLGFATAAQAGFQINAVKTDQGATDIVELYFYNDGLNNTGTALEAYEVTYSGTPLQFDWIPGDEYDIAGVDIYNHANDLSKSWFRVHPSRHGVHWASPRTDSTAWMSPIADFTIVYATFELTPLPAHSGLGARFGRLVIPDGADFDLAGKVGGEIGGAALANFNYDYFVANLAPVIEGGGTITSAAASSLLTHRVSARDTDGQLLAFTLSDLDHASTHGFDITRVSADAYDIMWNPAVVTPGNYDFTLVAQDSSVQSNSISTSRLTVQVVPEPSTVLISALLLPIRRRR